MFRHDFFYFRYCFLATILLFVLGGCAGIPGNQVEHGIRPLSMDHEPEPSELLDISLKVLDPGVLPEDPKERQGLSPEIRDAEARFFPVHLKYTLQDTGYWGTVRVVPDDDIGVDVLVRGRIEYSDGESCAVSIEAVDATGRVWFKKTYAETARPAERALTQPEQKDIFQDLFTTIANDLAAFRNKLTPAEVTEIREVAELRYAEAMAPDAFKDYLKKDASGRYHILRLPARDDPMLERVRKLQVRDDMLVDAINGYYNAYYRDLWEPYTDWRKFRGEEVSTMRKLERQALTRQILGVAAIVGAIAIGVAGDSDVVNRTGSLRDVMIMGGAAAVYSGYQKGKETEINKEAIEELDTSFKAEAEPLVVDVNGETIRLTGSAEQQYTRWRQLLRTMYARETGMIGDVEIEQSDTKPQPADLFTDHEK
jgi:hypothetical protein